VLPVARFEDDQAGLLGQGDEDRAGVDDRSEALAAGRVDVRFGVRASVASSGSVDRPYYTTDALTPRDCDGSTEGGPKNPPAALLPAAWRPG
jgi:hypothetical protein